METFGCSLPPGFKLPQESDDDTSSEPPSKKTKVIGPQCPSFINPSNISSDDSNLSAKYDSETPNIVGPVLPPSLRQRTNRDDDDEVYGPVPTDAKMDYNIVKIIEDRAANMKDRLHMKNAPVVESSVREEWMVVPDTSRKNQLGAISRCLAPGSKISKKEADSVGNPEEDKKTAKELKKYNKSKRAESLLDMHQKKKKKKDKKEKKSERLERKCFDRDEIAVRHFTEKQVNSVIDKAKYLNSRFAPGRSSSQYL